MRKISLVILINFILILSIDSENYNIELSNDFKKIIEVTEPNEKLIKFNINEVSYKEYFYFFTLASEELNRYNEFNSWLDKAVILIENDLKNFFKRTDVLNFDIKKQKEFAEKLLIFIHERFLKKYNYRANKISLIIDRGEFNCVSSSILYGLFLKKYGLKSMGIETQDHIFIKIIFDNSELIDVETTNKYGFNPGEKKDILDEFGKITGFNYVPPKDYKNRNEIDLKKILFLIYHNFSDEYYNSGDIIKSANLGYMIFLGRNDEKGKNDLEVSFNNYIAKLSSDDQYITAIESINSYIQFFGWNNNFINIRFNLILNYINVWDDFANFNDVKDFIVMQNNLFQTIKDEKRFIEIYYLYLYKLIIFFDNNNKFSDSYNLIKEFKSKYSNNEIEKLFNNIIIDEIKFYKNDFNLINKRLQEIKIQFPEYSKVIYKYEIDNYINNINNFHANKDLQKALNEAKIIFNLFPKEQRIKNVLLNCYINYTFYLYENKNLDDIIYCTVDGLKIFPNDRTLLNNFLSFFINFINEAIDKKDYSKARKILNTAKEKFPNDGSLINIDKYLESLRY